MSRRMAARSELRRMTNSRDVSIHCRVTEAINRNKTGLSSNRRRKPPVFISATNRSYCDVRAISRASPRHGRRSIGLPRLDETLVDCRSRKAAQFLEQQMAQASARGTGQIAGGPPSIAAQSSASACSTTGANRCSNAQGSAWPGAQAGGCPWPGLAMPPRSRSRPRSTQAWRRNPCGELWRISPARDRSTIRRFRSRRSNSDQSPLAHERHHAARRCAA